MLLPDVHTRFNNTSYSHASEHKHSRSGSGLDLPASEQIRQRPTFDADMMTPDVFRWVNNNKSTEQKLASGEAYILPDDGAEKSDMHVFLSLKQGFCRIQEHLETRTENF